jgi:3',5'-cyclic AMP phosphodiesterase CpdA
MVRIVHLSDLHFGRHDPSIAEALLADINRQAPDVVVVSGDFTQVGSRQEFKLARQFLDQLDCPTFAVPGNHDVPAIDIFTRLLNPYGRYREFIADELEPTMVISSVILLGLKTSRRMQLGWNWANGSISPTQRRSVAERLKNAPPDLIPIVVAHHPLMQPELPVGKPMHLVKRSDDALTAFAELGVRLVMSGHFHRSYRREHIQAVRGASQATADRSLIVLQAGSAISTRLRDDRNGYNVVAIDGSEMQIAVREWAGATWEDSREL